MVDRINYPYSYSDRCEVIHAQNDGQVRKVSFKAAPAPFKTHVLTDLLQQTRTKQKHTTIKNQQ